MRSERRWYRVSVWIFAKTAYPLVKMVEGRSRQEAVTLAMEVFGLGEADRVQVKVMGTKEASVELRHVSVSAIPLSGSPNGERPFHLLR